MKTLSVINLKGGVAKTITAANVAHVLATKCGKRVLLIDNDKQGNISKLFRIHSYEQKGMADVLTDRRIDIHTAIQHSDYAGLDLIGANMTLLKANLEVMLSQTGQQQTRLRTALAQVQNEYDFCVIDNAPDINISTINALAASDEVIIPIKIDKFAFDGLNELLEQIEIVREDFKPNLCIRGCLITCYQKNDVNRQGEEWLRTQRDFPVFATRIRRTEKVDESTFAAEPILEYSRWCNASRDYVTFVDEYLNVSNSDKEGA